MFPSVSVALGAGFHSSVSFEAGHVTFGGLGVNQAKGGDRKAPGLLYGYLASKSPTAVCVCHIGTFE